MNPVAAKLKDLPLEIQNVIKDEELTKIIDNICEDFDIPYTWRGDLIRGTVKVLSGLMEPKDFIPFIMEEYSFDQESAIQIAYAINEEIFSKVKPELASVHNIEDNKLAHKIRVPHKPRPIVEEYNEPVSRITEDEIKKIQENIPKPTSSELMKNIVIEEVASIPKTTDTISNPVETKKVETELSSKLGSLRFDKYREQF